MPKHKILLLFFIMHLGLMSFAQPMDWVSLPQEFGIPVTSLVVYQNELIAAGNTINVNANDTHIAAWDGTQWRTLGRGIRAMNKVSIDDMLVFNNELYVVGKFDSAGNVAAKSIARWDGEEWHDVGGGSNYGIRNIAEFNGELYVSGNFDTIGGVAASHIARWDGTNWHPLAEGVNPGAAIWHIYPYQHQLYVLGAIETAGNIMCEGIARWNGTTWDSLPKGYNYHKRMIEWNGKLLMGEGWIFRQGYEIIQFDGNGWERFSMQDAINSVIVTFFVFKGELLYSTYTTNSTQPSTVHKWDTITKQWSKFGTGITGKNPSVNTLCEYKGELYCGGDFSKKNGANHNYIARYALSTGLNNHSTNKMSFTAYPNPANEQLTINISSANKMSYSISITDVLGKVVYTSAPNNQTPYNINTQTFTPGIYFCTLSNEEHSFTQKIIINR